nr:MAG TPA: hypothetical protein [Caudoviricetes sp.]
MKVCFYDGATTDRDPDLKIRKVDRNAVAKWSLMNSHHGMCASKDRAGRHCCE